MGTQDGIDMSENFHYMAHQHDHDTITSEFICTAPITAECHISTSCDCEYRCDHTPVLNEECWIKDWMDDACATECFIGDKGAPVRGLSAIKVTFNGDCCEWEYADHPTAPNTGA